MALLRKDTPLADTPDPGKGNVTRTEIKNPNGSTTYKMNWNNSSSSSNAKPSVKSSSSPKVASRVSGSSGSREITTIIPMSKPLEKPIIGGNIDLNRLTNKVSTPSIEQRREDMRVKTYEKWKQQGESRSDYDARIKAATEKNAAKNKDNSRDLSGGSGKGPSGSGGCKSC